ncbi:MAG: glycosyltransferase family 9 protein [Parvibaculales bacterium]
MRQILFITSNRIGDAILSTGLLGHIMQSEPDASITVACGPLAHDLFLHAPGVEDIHVMRKQKFAGHWLELGAKVLGRRWHRVIDLRGSATAYLLWARHRHVLRANHTLPRVVHIGGVMGLTPPPAPRVWVDAVTRRKMDKMLPSDRPVLTIGSTSNWAPKSWMAESFAELVWELARPDGVLANAQIVLQGGPNEEKELAPILDALPPGQVTNLAGCDLITAAASMEKAALYIGNDSGLTHLAAAVGTPTLALFGPTRDDLYAPWGAHTAIVRARAYEDIVNDPTFSYDMQGTMMADLSVRQVYEAAVKLLHQQEEKI